jgi:hypothetical protein
VSEPPAGERAAPAKKAPRATARRPRKKTVPQSVQAVVFSLGGDEYALPIGQVQEVIAYTQPRTIASRVSWVRGVINLRDTTSRCATSPPVSAAARMPWTRHGSSSCTATRGRPG